MRYAEVAVDAPLGSDRTLTYAIPGGALVAPGQLVWVPLGRRLVQGLVFSLSEHANVESVREVCGIYGPGPIIPPSGLELARWISRRYLSDLFEAAALMLPPGFRARVQPSLRLTHKGVDAPDLPYDARQMLTFLRGTEAVPEAEITKAFGRKSATLVSTMLDLGVVERVWEMERPRAGPAYECHLRLGIPHDKVASALEALPRTASRQVALLRKLSQSDKGFPVTELRKAYGAGAVRSLVGRGYLAEEWVRSVQWPFGEPLQMPFEPVPSVLTPQQEGALARIVQALESPGHRPRSFLLHGVTGSGKTEVYLRAVERCIALGKQALFLVPEISLTPQALSRLLVRFPGRVAVLHSGLTLRQRTDQWWGVREGVYDLVVGARSALFAPFSNLGIIILDEEHEWTYKQEDSPRYHARDVAEEMARLTGAVLVMGSATPDVVTHFRAEHGRHALLELPGRVEAMGQGGPPLHRDTRPLAEVEIVDMRKELREGNRSMFSRALKASLEEAIGRGEQVILFLNRRGESTFVQCRDCGYVVRCRRCDVALVYHSKGCLLCHQCNASSRPPVVCPQCGSRRIRYLGLGTQKVVDEVQRMFPEEGVLRWDRDVATSGAQHQRLLERFGRGDARILVGTQMVTKGLHIPSVTLVGVVLADVGLYLPDLWSGERAFQLICQVSGRAGRGRQPGKVVVQTYSPDHYAVRAGASQDYHQFYRQELELRRQQGNPPFSRMAHLVYQHADSEACRNQVERMGRLLREQAYARGMSDVRLIGPAPAHPQRVRGRYRWHLIVRAREPEAFLRDTGFPEGWTVDIDPVSVL